MTPFLFAAESHAFRNGAKRMSAKDVFPRDREVGRRIKIRRLQLRLSQQSLADSLGLTFQQVQKYEKGINRISASRLYRVSEILGVSISFFFDDVGKSRDSNAAFEFLDTVYSLRLVQAFSRIQDRRIQRRTVELVEQIADSATGPKN